MRRLQNIKIKLVVLTVETLYQFYNTPVIIFVIYYSVNLCYMMLSDAI